MAFKSYPGMFSRKTVSTDGGNSHMVVVMVRTVTLTIRIR